MKHRFSALRLDRAALAAAALLLAPTAIAAEPLESKLNSAVSYVQHMLGMTAPETIETLKSGLDALASRDIDGARSIRDSLPKEALDRHILTWAVALYGGSRVPSQEISAAAETLRGWPGLDTLQQNGERALARENAGPREVIAAFDGKPPLTMQGAVILARARLHLSDTDGARAALVPFWRTEKLEPEEERALIAEFGALIPAADHRFRMERMLYAERANSAQRMAPLAGAKALADAWSAVFRGDKTAGMLLDAVPADQRSAGYIFAKAKYLRWQKKYQDAAAVMLSAPEGREALVDPDAWWIERRVLSRELLDAGDVEAAYRIAAGHSAESPANAADAEFHAGWYALRGLRDPKIAAQHFARIAEVSEGAISLSRAYYWLGRAAEDGGPGDAMAYYRRAASYGATFYGQLASEKAGSHTLNIATPQPSEADVKTFGEREAVNAIKRLEQAGYPRYADALYRDLARQLTSPGEVALLADMAEKQKNHYLALRIGKAAAGNGVDVGALSHPVGVIPTDTDISGSGTALAYAIARQESEFNVGAVSGVGARGLLQLMPGTAKDMARKAGLPYSQSRLTTDAGYNAALGSVFLGEQLGRFNGSYVLTFAGYNAGPGRARQWVQRYGDPRGKPIETVVDWIERIPFAETRSYVQRVMENYQVYKMRLSGSVDIAGDLVNGR
ncbi:lytic transglycosylase domain-containing protein [Corticibacterium sp. UT-5YL-CI-8]|nr:lytic transglycosylase domain-containing protein [Tianweitania sp. UT-5YL-CI-8]